MEKALIFHGTGASPEDHWFPWIKQKLEHEGIEVYAPDFPTPEGQTLENWETVLLEEDVEIDDDTVLIGHSTGAVFILDLLNDWDIKVEASFLISGFYGPLNDERFDPLNESFAEREFDFQEIREASGEIHQFHSASDPYVPMEKAEELAAELNSSLHPISEAGHFNTEAGYTDFPRLWSMLSRQL